MNQNCKLSVAVNALLCIVVDSLPSLELVNKKQNFHSVNWENKSLFQLEEPYSQRGLCMCFLRDANHSKARYSVLSMNV